MPENNHEVIIDGYVYPDTVTITLANDDFVGSRDYVSKDLYESVDSANDYWQAENAKLRELVQDMFGAYKGAVEMLPSSYSKNVMERAVMDISDRMRELGVEL